MSINEKMTVIADNIRNKLETTEKLGLDEMAAAVDSIYAKAHEQGVTDGKQTAYNEVEHLNEELERILYGTDTGGKSHYDAFWNAYQGRGYQTTCDYFFAGNGWTNGNLKPKYNIKPTRANSMFALSNFNGDLAKHFEDLGIELDFSNCTMAQNLFVNSYSITRIGVLDFRKVTYGAGWFQNCKGLVTIDKLIMSENTVLGEFDFNECFNLVNLTVEGVVAKTKWNFKWCEKLSKASIESVINCLSTTTSGLSVTFSKTAKEAAFTADEWSALIATKPNWTISLI